MRARLRRGPSAGALAAVLNLPSGLCLLLILASSTPRIGSWIMEELVHHVDLVLWYFARWGDPVAASAVGFSRGGDPALTEAVTATLRFSGGRYAVVTLTGLRVPPGLRSRRRRRRAAGVVVRRNGSDTRGRLWVTVRRRGTSAPVAVPLETSGELFELEEELRLIVGAFRERRALVAAEEARKAVAVCLAVEAALRDGRGTIPVSWTPSMS